MFENLKRLRLPPKRLSPVSSVGEFISTVLANKVASTDIVAYRGHSNDKFILTPSIFREKKSRENEHILLRELIAAHPDEFRSDATALELLVRMQHYSLPTRLLDVTFNPLVSLYFASEENRRREPYKKDDGGIGYKNVAFDGEVLLLTVKRRSLKYFDSDTVSCLANLARLGWDLKEKINTSLPMEDFNKETSIRRLLHFIRQEKLFFDAEIDPSDIDSAFLVKPKQNNRRILAQAGAFFVFGEVDEISQLRDHIRVTRIPVPSGAKTIIRAQLDKLGINEKTMFPEVDRAARYIAANIC